MHNERNMASAFYGRQRQHQKEQGAILSEDNGSTRAPDDQRPRGVDDLAQSNGPPLTTSELAHMLGMSSTFIREEIRSGHLRAVSVGRGRKRVFRIPVSEAHRYAKELGLV